MVLQGLQGTGDLPPELTLFGRDLQEWEPTCKRAQPARLQDLMMGVEDLQGIGESPP